MLKLRSLKKYLFFAFLLGIFLVMAAQAQTIEKHNCKGVSPPCSSRGICHSKGFCICRNNYYGQQCELTFTSYTGISGT